MQEKGSLRECLLVWSIVGVVFLSYLIGPFVLMYLFAMLADGGGWIYIMAILFTIAVMFIGSILAPISEQQDI